MYRNDETDEKGIFMVVTVVDRLGSILGRSARTPPGDLTSKMAIIADETTEPRYVFFQLKQFKKKKNITKVTSQPIFN
eukprot:1392993-Amorphochlora_amoeboformis.AAC.1